MSEFLKALQLHIYEYGLFRECRADLGSQITSGFNSLRVFFSDMETQTFFRENGIASLVMEQFCKGNSALGSLVESLVKQTKYLINKTITTNILDFFEFHFLVAQTVHLINRRPVAFREALRSDTDFVPDAITPEMLIHGYHLTSLNTIPDLQNSPIILDPDWNLSVTGTKQIQSDYKKIKAARNKLNDVYHSEFLANLVYQAVDRKDRYKNVKHSKLEVGDIILLKDPYLKPTNYPMGRVTKVDTNALGETTSAWIIKGNREKVYRHAQTIIPLLKCTFLTTSDTDREMETNVNKVYRGETRRKRAAALKCIESNRELAKNNNC